jgi:hypothetical protein
MTVKIKREDLLQFFIHEDYIKSKCRHVRDVYSNSIYFHSSKFNMSWFDFNSYTQMQVIPELSIQDLILAGINAMCNTEFVFED